VLQDGTSNDTSYKQHRLRERTKEISRQLQLLKETLERRFYTDLVIETAIDNLSVELQLLARDIDRS
jgi:hypothetical protein